MKLVWTERAIADLAAIGDYIARESRVRARAFTAKLIRRMRQAARFPQSGRIVPELGDPTVRELIEGNYRLVYRVKARRVAVLQVFEAHRDWRP